MGSQRIDAIDIAKGLGIWLVYIGHVPPSAYVLRFIYNFHMPLFFFLSGLFLDEKKYSLKDFVITRCKTLLIPLVTFCIFAVVINFIPSFDFKHPSMGIGGAALWFLPVLFFSEVIVYLLWCLTSNILARIFFAVFLCFTGVLIERFSVVLPFALQAVPLSAGFYAFGALLGQIVRLYYTEEKSRGFWMSLLCFVALASVAFVFEDYTNIHDNHIMCGILGFIVAFAGILMIVIFSRTLDSQKLRNLKRVLLYSGHNSLIIFGTHLSFKGLYERIIGNIVISDPVNFTLGNICVWGG